MSITIILIFNLFPVKLVSADLAVLRFHMAAAISVKSSSHSGHAAQSSCTAGPGYASPLEAMAGPREALMYVTCLYNGTGREKPDYLATVDVDPTSSSYSKVIHRLPVPYIGDELHHSGWNACSSCHGNSQSERRFLILPSILSTRIYVIDTQENPRSPSIHKIIEPADILEKAGLSYPHSPHCLPSHEVVISCLGDENGESDRCGFLLLGSDFSVKGRWEMDGQHPPFCHDFWYQPRHDALLCTSFSHPKCITREFDMQDVQRGLYGRSLCVYNWPGGALKQVIELGDVGLGPLEIRFLHDPSKDIGFVVCAIASNVIRFFKKSDGTWAHEVAISVAPLNVDNWMLPKIPGFITDMLISLDDRFLYISNWIHGDIRQYDIRNPKNPTLVGQLWIGGLLQKGNSELLKEQTGIEMHDGPIIQGKKLRGGPHRMQLSLDGKRLYVTNSLFSTWDKQWYPKLREEGSHMIQIDVDIQNGGISINPNFFVDFGLEPEGPSLAHDMRYPGGDCTSDIWV